jgi:hypothetical protein
MRLVQAALPLLVLTAALVPEVRLYAAERQLARATAAVRFAQAASAADPARTPALDWARSAGLEAAYALPGDSRAWMAAAAAELLAGRSRRSSRTGRRSA